MDKIIHIVFEAANQSVLEATIALDPRLEGIVWEIKDDFSVGTLQNLDTLSGWENRKKWWATQLIDTPYAVEEEKVSDKKIVAFLLEKITENPALQIWIWAADNVHDICGYYWLIDQFKTYYPHLFLIHLHRLPFIHEKGHIFYPHHLFEISPKELIKVQKIALQISYATFETDKENWQKLRNENKPIRLLVEGKQIIQKEENHWDELILEQVTHKPLQKLTKIISTLLQYPQVYSSDVFLWNRIKYLAATNKIKIDGTAEKDWKNKTVSLIHPTVQP